MTRFLEDERICLSNNAAERALSGIAIGRRNWTICGSDADGDRATAMYNTLIETAKLNDVDPQAMARRHPRPQPRSSRKGHRIPLSMELEDWAYAGCLGFRSQPLGTFMPAKSSAAMHYAQIYQD